MTLERLFHVLLKRRWLTALLLIGACIPAVQLAGKVRTDQAVEHMFPVADPTRETYDAYKAIFPYDDAHAIVVMEADDLWAEAGLVRADRLEEEFRALEGVIKVDGPVSVRDVAGSDTTISLRRIFPRVDLPDDEREQAIKTAQTDPMFAWNFAHPERKTASIQVLLNIDYARTDELRRAFNKSADEIIERHRHEWKSLMITGIPVIRGRYIQMVQVDKDVLLPLAYLVITLIVAFSYRSVVVVFGTVLTIAAALIWTVAGMAGLDMPFTLLTSFSPIIVMIISISDTVHIATDLDTRMRRGIPRRQALVEAMADGAGPCLLTEITIAAGFLSMTLVNVTAISEFGIVTAIGMMLAWFANMTVLPLILSFGRKVPKVAPAAATPGGTWVLRTWKRFIDWIEVQVTQHTRRVVGVAVVLLLVPAIAATSLDRVHLVFDDLWPESALKKEIEYGESSRGGLVPLAIFLEADDALRAKSPSPVLEPEALRFMDAAEAKMRALGVEGDRPVKWAG
ncbi:MAG: efflux RND transporter permease subunit, partial [Planctomycetota bacterium]